MPASRAVRGAVRPRKAAIANAAISSRRSRSDGMRIRKNVQPIVEIISETPGATCSRRSAIRGCHNAHVNAQSFALAQPLELALLQDAQTSEMNARYYHWVRVASQAGISGYPNLGYSIQ